MKARLTRLLHQLRTQGQTPAQKASAVALGFFIGATPFFGFHFLMSIALGRVLGLNLLWVYVAANISNPVVAPFLTLAEIQSGAWLRRGRVYTLSHTPPDVWSFTQDLLLGTLVVGGALAALGFAATWVIASRQRRDSVVARLFEETALRYLPIGITSWQFAQAKLAGDPVYRAMLEDGVLPSSGTLVDIGCGPGLTLAAIATAPSLHDRGIWPSTWPAPPRLRLWGLEYRPRAAAIAREALGTDATIVTGDLRSAGIPACRAALLFDVLHLVGREDQDRLLARLAALIEPGGVLALREADAAGGWRFQAVKAGNTLVAMARGTLRPVFHFRTVQAWQAALARLGFEVTLRQPEQNGVLANVLLYAVKPAPPGWSPQ